MPSTHVSLHYHLVFSTKNREPWLPPSQRPRVHDYLGGILRGMNGVPHAVGGMADHIHVFAGLRATHCLADVMRELKSESSNWIHKELEMPGFGWQEGYGAFTVSASSLDQVRPMCCGSRSIMPQPHSSRNTWPCSNAAWWSTMSATCGSWRAGFQALALRLERSAFCSLKTGGSASLHHRLPAFKPPA
jgi:REP element-mobilizing transposase RayT